MSRPESHPNAAEIEAAEWLLRIEDGLSPDEEGEFARWIEADPGHAETMARQAALLGTRPSQPRPVPPPVRRRVWRAPAAAGLAAALAAATAAVLFVWRPDDVRLEPLQLATGTGAVNEQVLSDASRLWIDAQTEAAFSAARSERTVELSSGRIFVEVEKDPRRPFTVSAGSIQATALGTAFEVTRFPAYSQVLVAEGRVRVVAAKTEHVLAAGDRLRMDRNGVVELGDTDPGEIGGWRSYRLTFRGVRLSDVVDEMNRYRVRPLVVQDPELASQEISGVFPVTLADEPATPEMLAAATGAVVSEDTGNRIALTPASD